MSLVKPNKVESRITFQCERSYKNSWVSAAQKSESKLADWLIEAGNEKLAREFPEIIENYSQTTIKNLT